MVCSFQEDTMHTYPALSFEQLLALPAAETAVITANNRLTVFIKGVLLSHLKTQAKTINLPTIAPYKAWLTQLADELVFKHPEMPIVLNETAQRWYWQQALLKKSDDEVLNPSAAAASLSQAHRLQNEWQIDVREDEQNPEYEAFMAWRAEYQQTVQALSAWDTPRFADEILAALNQAQLRVPKHLVLLGFYSLSAYQKQLLSILAAQGTQIYTWALHRESAQTVRVFQANDVQQELYAALAWVKEHIQTYPQHRLALVIPSLQEEAAYIRRLLNKTLADTVLDKRWHMAVGRPLSEWGLVRSVLAWFALLADFQKTNKVDVAKIGEALLNAGFAFDPYYADELASWDSELRQKEWVALSRTQFLDKLTTIHVELAQVFQSQLTIWSSSNRCADWAQIYRETLSAFGFPGTMSLSSVNYQLCRAFEQAIKKFALLDEMLPALNATEALHLFQQQLMQTSFQGQRAKDVVLDIVGLYETEGGQWDAVWVLGLTDKVLPQMPSPNPYLPIRSQRRCGVMHATPESEMQWAEQIFNSILHSAPYVTLSWAHQEGDEVLRHSSLLKPYLSQAQILPESVSVPLDSVDTELIIDNKGLPKQGYVSGGYGTLERQSKNPLWAYA
ncbi:MAG: hypothetical protein SOX43_00180, partial [Pelistega sp.]|nr:hypothetical protein [Pelistega sp.]